MHLQKLVTHLQRLNKTQLKRFDEFVHSPYFKVPASSIALFDYLALLHPQFEEKKFLPPAIAKKVKDLPTENKQAKAGTELLKSMERFLAIEHWAENDRNVLIDLLWAQNKMQWQTLQEDNLDKLQQRLAHDKEKDIDYFYHRHLLSTIENHGYAAKTKRNLQNDLNPVAKTLDEYYAIKKLRYHCELISRHQILGTPYKKENIEEILEILEPYNNINFPYVYLFINVYTMYTGQSYETCLPFYQNIKQFAQQTEAGGVLQATYESIEYALSMSANWLNKGQMNAAAEALWCFEFKIRHNQLLEHGKITPINFRTVVVLAIMDKRDPKWINHFIETYAPNLSGENAATNLAFAQAQYYHYIKNYKRAMPLYQQAQVKDEPVFNAVVRRWQFMCLYEQDPANTTLLLDYLNAFEQYLKRNADSLHHVKDTFALIINYSRKLLNATNKPQGQTLTGQLEKENYFAGKPWVLEQLANRK